MLLGTIATYSCSTGYFPVGGPSLRVCGTDGNWNGPAPNCEGTGTTCICDEAFLEGVELMLIGAFMESYCVIIIGAVTPILRDDCTYQTFVSGEFFIQGQ